MGKGGKKKRRYNKSDLDIKANGMVDENHG